MSTTPGIQSLLETGAYSAESIPQLERYVNDQVAGLVPYHFDANRTLAKLFQFFPEKASDAVLARILTLAMLQFPKTDVLALLCLIPEKSQESEPIATVIRCFELLDACKFKDFWTAFKELEGNADLKAMVKPDQIRQGIVDVLALSYRVAPIGVVKVALNVDTVDASYTNVESVSATDVVFVATADNTKRSRVFQEGVKFSAISSFVAASQ